MKCPECEGDDLSVTIDRYNSTSVVDGRLRLHDVGVHLIIGCESCSETVGVIPSHDADSFLTANLDNFVASMSDEDSGARNVRLPLEACDDGLVLREEWITGEHEGKGFECSKVTGSSHVYVQYGDKAFLVNLRPLIQAVVTGS